jgi:hypothetical protein
MRRGTDRHGHRAPRGQARRQHSDPDRSRGTARTVSSEKYYAITWAFERPTHNVDRFAEDPHAWENSCAMEQCGTWIYYNRQECRTYGSHTAWITTPRPRPTVPCRNAPRGHAAPCQDGASGYARPTSFPPPTVCTPPPRRGDGRDSSRARDPQVVDEVERLPRLGRRTMWRGSSSPTAGPSRAPRKDHARIREDPAPPWAIVSQPSAATGGSLTTSPPGCRRAGPPRRGRTTSVVRSPIRRHAPTATVRSHAADPTQPGRTRAADPRCLREHVNLRPRPAFREGARRNARWTRGHRRAPGHSTDPPKQRLRRRT